MYQPYKGRRSQRHRQWRNILVGLLCLFIVACVIFLIFFQDKLVYSAEGARFRLPWSKPEGSGQITGEVIDFDVVPPEDTTVLQPEALPAKTLEVSPALLSSTDYLEQLIALKNAGALDAIALEVKDREGAVLSLDTVAEELAALKQAGISCTAVLYAYEDNAFAGEHTAAALTNAEGRAWRTPAGEGWLSPVSDEAQNHLMQQISACLTAGFDEVLFKSFGWPIDGRLDRIRYGDYAAPEARADLLAANLKTFAQAAGSMRVSVYIDDPTAESGLNEASGQDVAKLYGEAAYVYAFLAVQTETSGASVKTIMSAWTGEDTSRIIPVYTDLPLAETLLPGENALYAVYGSTGLPEIVS